MTSVSQTKSTTRATFDVPWWKKYRKLAELRVSDKLLNESTIFPDSQIPQISRVVAHAKNQLDPSSHFKRTSWQADGETQDHGTYCASIVMWEKTKKTCCYSTSNQRPHCCCPLANKVEILTMGKLGMPKYYLPTVPLPMGKPYPQTNNSFLGPYKRTS